MKAIVLAGGSGTRLWPLSRKSYPKQFLRLNEQHSLIQQAIERLLKVLSQEDIIIITNKEYKFYVKAELDELFGNKNKTHVIFEPAGKNTAPAIALGLKYCEEILGASEDEAIVVCPSDHVIKPAEGFAAYLRKIERIIKNGYIITFGINPDRPETGYGYIKKGSYLQNFDEFAEIYNVDKFTEKPNVETANEYIKSGNYFWNSGMFAFSIGVMKNEIKQYSPNIWGLYTNSYEDMIHSFINMPEISLDFAIMEKSSKIVAIPLNVYWNDIGSWDSVFEIMNKDTDGNVKLGNVVTMDTKDSMLLSGNRLMAVIGLDDCLAVETDDVVLIARRGQTQKVKDMVNILKRGGRREVKEHVTIYRPWGSYTILEKGPRYQIKRVVVNPGEKLSLQMHYHRSEHWVIVRGTATVTIEDKVAFVHENESAFVPKSTKHRLENPGKIPLEIIEVQNGEYVSEDDIIRFDDIYEREV
ncbi:mannose-1-phosphate guanyltransferase [Candidatus Magnetoovum chiemensis]|nr:mannose-1-phosphate guanyltransferase [Candidatus Magnetoovum chiemensis]